MTTRRAVLIAMTASAFAPSKAASGQYQKVYRIGYVSSDPDQRSSSPTFKAFVGGLRELGWIEGKNIEIRIQSSQGRDELFPRLLSEIVSEKMDVIVTSGSAATRAAKAATDNIPIVFASAANPVDQKLVMSMTRPGGNVTGFALSVQELGPKRLEILKEMLPRATRFLRLYQASSIVALQSSIISEDDSAARKLGVLLQHVPVSDMKGIKSALADAARAGTDAVILTSAGLFVGNRVEIARLALGHQLPLICTDARFTDAGALISYGENYVLRHRRAASSVDKILRGMKPAEIPVEQTSIFELVVNLQTARALGTIIPDSILLQADRVIK